MAISSSYLAPLRQSKYPRRIYFLNVLLNPKRFCTTSYTSFTWVSPNKGLENFLQKKYLFQIRSNKKFSTTPKLQPPVEQTKSSSEEINEEINLTKTNLSSLVEEFKVTKSQLPSIQEIKNYLENYGRIVNLFEKLEYTLKKENSLKELGEEILPSIFNKKKFAINGAIKPKEIPFVYFVDLPAYKENKKLLDDIKRNQFLMLMGSRITGKTTRVYQLMKQLHEEGYICLFTSFANITANEKEGDFWKNLDRSLRRSINKHFKDRKFIESSNDFLDVFAENEWKKKVIIFIDDFEQLYNVSNEIRDDCLNTFQCIKSSIHDFAICSIVAIGTFNIQYLKTTNKRISPFSIRESFNNPNFSKQQIQALFNDFTQEKAITMDKEIIDDIYLQTNGHPGLVSYYGHLIDENLLDKVDSHGNLNLTTWQTYFIKSLYIDIQNFQIFERLKDVLLDQSDDTRKAMNLLRLQFLSNSNPCYFNYDNEHFSSLNFLVNEGVLKVENSRFMISSPLLRSFILQHIMPKVIKFNTSEKSPIRNDGSFDIFKLLTEAVKFFDMNYIKLAAKFSQKKAKVIVENQRNILIPQENVYQQELAIIIKNWLKRWEVISQYRAGTVNNCNLVITAPGKPTAVIDIVATKTSSELKEHFNQTLTYAQSLDPKLKVSDIWLAHFTCQDFFSKMPVWPTTEQQEAGLNIIHIWHDLKFSTMRICACWKDSKGMQEVMDDIIR
ncbi:hypothetical protein C1645_843109 [Glomus cerebriforme]|uniref:P-loop containing nucleoside triphosphate hydrolase protein n=1 Tax=Glomus cerebriforme TaxID=658196 RepID=A0A397T8B9_9GLOM|nr:hypothetical protein C1645_843109 [Glomus cerebriforme]